MGVEWGACSGGNFRNHGLLSSAVSGGKRGEPELPRRRYFDASNVQTAPPAWGSRDIKAKVKKRKGREKKARKANIRGKTFCIYTSRVRQVRNLHKTSTFTHSPWREPKRRKTETVDFFSCIKGTAELTGGGGGGGGWVSSNRRRKEFRMVSHIYNGKSEPESSGHQVEKGVRSVGAAGQSGKNQMSPSDATFFENNQGPPTKGERKGEGEVMG